MMRMLRDGNVAALFVPLAFAVLGSAAFAQSSRPPSEGPSATVLEEIVVTARKREESLQDVPLSVTAVTSAKISELRIQSPDDLARFTPGFSYVSSFGRINLERPVVRGQSNILGAANASFFVDGVYVSGPSASTETANLERIEVIKGPQAALYGRATFAGAINYITKRPTNEFEGKITATGAQYGEHEGDIYLSGPIVADKLFFYASGRVWKYGGEYTNAIDGRKLGQEGTNSGTVKLLWTPIPGFEATLLGTYSQDDDPGGLALGFQGAQYNNCQLRVITGNLANGFAGSQFPRSGGYFCGTVQKADQLVTSQRTDVMDKPGLQRDTYRGTLTTKTTFGGGYEFVTTSSYHHEKQQTELDVSYAGYDPFIVIAASQTGSFWRQQQEVRKDFAQELRLRSPSDRPFRWLIGGYYLNAHPDDQIEDNKFLPPTAPASIVNGPGCQSLGGGVVTCPNGQGNLFYQTVKNTAEFASLEYDFAERFTATAEVRHTKEDQVQNNANDLPPFCSTTAPTAVPGVTFNSCQFSGTFTSTTPRVTLRFKQTPDIMYYVNWAKGTKPGGFNTASAVVGGINSGIPVPAVYDEEQSKVIEIGGKFRYLGGRATTNVALFYTDLTGQQLTSNVAATVNGNTVLNSYVANIGKTEIKGIEIEAAYLISDHWDAQATFSYVDSKIKQFYDNNQEALYSPAGAFTKTVSPFYPVTLCDVTGRPSCSSLINADLLQYGNVAGQTSPRVPKIQASFVTGYGGVFTDSLKWRLSGDVTYEGSKYAQVDNLAETGAHTYVGLRFALSGKNWDFTLFGKNLTNDLTSLDILRYIDYKAIPVGGAFFTTFGGVSPRGFVMTLPQGRQFGATASFKF